MALRLVRTAQAERDLIEIGAYIAMEDPNAAIRVLANLDAKSTLLCSFPQLGRPDLARPGRRIHTVGNYLIIYKEEPDRVSILRYLHSRRDRRWL
jgi:toxin ParE1/3/4